jgi:hypothetical protein
MTQLSVKDELHRLIDGLAPDEAERILDLVNNLLDTDELTPEEEAAVREGREQIARGEFVTLEDL